MKRRKRKSAKGHSQKPGRFRHGGEHLFFDLQPLNETGRRRSVVVQNIRPAPQINGRN